MTELLPCPFCGGEGVLCRPPLGRTYVCCDANFCSGPKNTDTEAIAAWNRRAPVWQLISTAPKDGSKVMLHGPVAWLEYMFDDAAPLEEASVFGSFSDGEWRTETANPYSDIVRPTHWQPLPAPPQEPTNE